MHDDLLALILVFTPFSLMSIGGGAAVLAGIQHESVTVHGWLSAREFVDFFAISRAAPGPGMMIATLIGWKVGGWFGAIVATLALFLPSSLLCYFLVRVTDAHREHRWHRIVREGLAPVGVGLTAAGLISLFRISGGGFITAAICLASAAVLMWMPRIPILAVLALGGAATALAAQSGWM